jgi:hypothetical protein
LLRGLKVSHAHGHRAIGFNMSCSYQAPLFVASRRATFFSELIALSYRGGHAQFEAKRLLDFIAHARRTFVERHPL